jgi:uncharacterized membrane protein
MFAGSLAGFGVLSLISGDFALNWQPVPAWVPWRDSLAHLSGLLLLVSGAGTFFRRSAATFAQLLTINVLIWLLLLQLPRVASHPLSESAWLGFAETLMMVAGGWIIRASLREHEEKCPERRAADLKSIRIARVLFAAALPPVGLSHFVYASQTAALVPRWLPQPYAIACLTGAAHIAAGTGLLVGVLLRLSAVLEAEMISGFTLLVWLPRVLAAPTDRFQWTALFASSTLAGAAWAVGGSVAEAGSD